MTKETSVVFLAGIVLVSAWRAGRQRIPRATRLRACRCSASCPVVRVPLRRTASTLGAIGGWAANPQLAPPRFSLAASPGTAGTLSTSRFSRVFALAFVIGVVLAFGRLLRGRVGVTSVEPELLGGLCVSYLGMTLLVHKDPRYTLPMLVYVAVLATGWIATLPRRRLRVTLSTAVVVLAAIYARWHLRRNRRCCPDRASGCAADDDLPEPAHAV